MVGGHGTESTGRIRVVRAVEVYNNTYAGTNQNYFVGGIRSGIVLFHDNSISGYSNPAQFVLVNYRSIFPLGFGGEDGTNPWDVNEPNIFFSGTAAAASAGTTVTVSGVNWTANQWSGYTLRRTSAGAGTNYSWIQSNTSNSITYSDAGGFGPNMTFAAGNALEIRKVDFAIDQPGRALGSMLSGDPPPLPIGWNDQVTEPCYSWNNGGVNFSAGVGTRQGVHFFNNTPMPGYTHYTYPHPLVTGGEPSPTPTATPTSTPTSMSILGNISTRGFVHTGNNVMIGGFIVQGTLSKKVILRAIGPELTPFGVPNELASPTLELHNSTGALIASNDNWQTTILGGIITHDQVQQILGSGRAPTDGRESAIVANLPPGNYTAIVHGVNGTTGVALVEVYDLNPGVGSILGNISTRGFVQTGNNVMIGGFIVQGTLSKKVILRAIGPELTHFGISNALANPTLELHDESGAMIATNDNWQTTILGGIIASNQVSDIQNSGHAPTAAFESAIIAILPAGNYTAIVRGVNNTTGNALMEVYDLDH